MENKMPPKAPGKPPVQAAAPKPPQKPVTADCCCQTQVLDKRLSSG